jgi:hypothetical protein
MLSKLKMLLVIETILLFHYQTSLIRLFLITDTTESPSTHLPTLISFVTEAKSTDYGSCSHSPTS